MQRLFPVVLAATCLAGVGLAARQADPDAAFIKKAKAIHERILTIDSHVDIGGATYATPALDPGGPTSLKCDLPKMKAGGLDGVFLAVFVGQNPNLDAAGYKTAYDQAISKFDAIARLTKMHPELCELARTPAEVERVQKTGKRIILVGLENGYPIGDDPANVKTFFDLGARYITLVHTAHNQVTDSAGPREPMHNGLSPFGARVVAEMNRLGIMVDVSHASKKSFWDVIKVSKAPIIASHSGCSAVNDNPRNLDDEQLKALAKNGGVIQIVALAEYLEAASPERQKAVQALREELGLGRRAGGPGAPGGQAGQGAPQVTPEQRGEMEKRRDTYRERMKAIDAKYPGATLKDFADHIDHAVQVAGIDHVGVGTDFDGGGGIPGFNDHSEAMNVTVELLRRGYTEDQIAKIWGGNLMRVWREVDRAAKR
ncbi:MAG TPA: dipeptidase [Vicinamibacterales bacterium]